jgi:hypothetical protein
MQFGGCYMKAKVITFHPIQHHEEMLDSLLHEGLHAIMMQRSYIPELSKLCDDERVVPVLVSDILGYLKQVADVRLKS